MVWLCHVFHVEEESAGECTTFLIIRGSHSESAVLLLYLEGWHVGPAYVRGLPQCVLVHHPHGPLIQTLQEVLTVVLLCLFNHCTMGVMQQFMLKVDWVQRVCPPAVIPPCSPSYLCLVLGKL